ncbi:uncharacterized protein LOC144497819 [Mustelus asterias]
MPFLLFFKILTPPILWIWLLLLDGDYYTCFWIMEDERVTNKTCTEFNCSGTSSNMLSGLYHHCTYSRLIGGSLTFIFLFIMLLLYSLHCCTCCNIKNYFYKYQYDYLHEMKKEQLIMRALQTRADKKAKKYVDNRIKELHSFLDSVSEENDGANGIDENHTSGTADHSGMNQETGEPPESIELIKCHT